MINPCRKCIVNPMCKSENTCEDAKDYLQQKIFEFKPPGSNLSPSLFLSTHMKNIRNNPNRPLYLNLSLPNDMQVDVIVIVKDGEIIEIRKEKWLGEL